MARKKRRLPEQFQAPVSEEDKKKVIYKDEFQSNVGKKVENFGRQFEGKGKTILYALAGVAVLAVLIGIFYAWNRRSTLAAETALGRAIETSNAQVTTSPEPGSIGKVYKTEQERANAAISDFQAVIDKYDGAVEEKAKYFIAVNKLTIDRPAAIQDLEALSSKTDDVGALSKFALAQAKAADGKTDEAIQIYQELANLNNPILAKDTINYELAKLYQKQGKKDEAANLFYEVAKNGSEMKDAEGKPLPMSETAQDAKKRLEEINPNMASQIKEPQPDVKSLTF